MKNKRRYHLLLPVIIGFWIIGCKQQPSPLSMVDCGLKIPDLSLDSLRLSGVTVNYYFTDTFPIPSWNYYDELSIYLAGKKCLGGEGIDSIRVTFRHDSRSISRTRAAREASILSASRIIGEPYWAFLDFAFESPKFREALVLMEHLIGKMQTKNPEEGEIYNADVFPFLMSVSNGCHSGNLIAGDLEVFNHVVEEIKSRPGFQRIVRELEDLVRDCKLSHPRTMPRIEL